MLIVGGDWKARPGPVDTAAQHILGKFAVGTRCGNCDRLVNFASANRVVVSIIRFQHPQRYLVTWVSNDGRTRNQIGHMLVRPSWASSVIDCRAYNEAQTGSEHGSNHATVRTCLRLRMKAASISNRPAKLDTENLITVALKYRRLELGLLLKDEVAGALRDNWEIRVGTGSLAKRLRLARIKIVPNHQI